MITRLHKCLACGAVFGLLMMASVAMAEQSSVAELINKAKSADEAVRLRAIFELGAPGGEAAPAVAALVDLLKDKSPAVRAHAATSLGKIGKPAIGAVPNLISLLTDPDEAVRRQAVGALVAIRPGPKVGVPLFVTLMADSDEAVRMRVLDALASAGADAVPAMVEALKNDVVAYRACLVLREIGPDAVAAVPALTEKLADPRPEIRREAALALAAIGKGASPAVAKIAALLGDEAMRVPATYALGCIGEIPKDAEPAVRTNAHGQDALLSEVSLWALARVHPEDKTICQEAVETLASRLKDADPFVRAAAARGLASLAPPPEIMQPALEKALEGADATTVQYALDALAGMGAPAVPRLIKALAHEKIRSQVVYILGQIGPAAAPATDALVALIHNDDADVANEAVHALAKIGPGAKAAVPELVKAVQQPESPVRHAAAYALGKMGPEAKVAEPVLLNLVKDSDSALALIGAWAVVQIKGASAETAAIVVPVLRAGLESPVPQLRQGAAEALGSLGPLAKEAVEPLKKASSDQNDGVRAAAAKALQAVQK